MKETGTGEQTPEQLLKILETEIATRRSAHRNAGRNRAILLVGGLLFIVIFAGVALLVLEQMLAELPRGRQDPPPGSEQAAGNF